MYIESAWWLCKGRDGHVTSRVGNCLKILALRWRCWLCLADGRICCPSAADLTSGIWHQNLHLRTRPNADTDDYGSDVRFCSQIWLSGTRHVWQVCLVKCIRRVTGPDLALLSLWAKVIFAALVYQIRNQVAASNLPLWAIAQLAPP